ncbi:NSFL1 cofactor p47 [Bombyx mandarina]|uniref:NSFL1 cofactor p47 n=2 Tax=Bombyx TaxID=7090 RepID=A0A8R2MA54_BOMMO|nr:NSFL1 cofactor p47 [Bombyx mandarina]XP_037877135.1 NSFL1 cofactor p47 isoform X2 [Bombyx mori]
MSANREDTLRQFCDVTGADEDRSKFFLESSNWQLDVALSSFYENGGNADEAPANPTSAASFSVLPDSDMESPPVSPQVQKSQKKEKKKTSNTKFGTIGSLQQESSSDEEEGQAFYAGGSERSGQQILGPSKGRKDIVSEMFKSVRERGAVVFEDEPTSSRGRGRGGLFAGVGYRLGQTADDHEPVSASNPQQQEQVRLVRLCLYREGFTVDAGPLRHYSDPENAEFLSCIRRGEIPSELSGQGVSVRVSLEDSRHEECPRHVVKPQAFAGKGHMLGSPTPPTVGATAAVAGDQADRAANLRAAQSAVTLDETQPVTTLQFRLADGTRITGRFNHSHTVGALREFVSRAEPAYQLRPFSLLTAFPSAELGDDAATLAQANLLNSTVMQRLK